MTFCVRADAVAVDITGLESRVTSLRCDAATEDWRGEITVILHEWTVCVFVCMFACL